MVNRTHQVLKDVTQFIIMNNEGNLEEFAIEHIKHFLVYRYWNTPKESFMTREGTQKSLTTTKTFSENRLKFFFFSLCIEFPRTYKIPATFWINYQTGSHSLKLLIVAIYHTHTHTHKWLYSRKYNDIFKKPYLYFPFLFKIQKGNAGFNKKKDSMIFFNIDKVVNSVSLD